MTAFRLDKETPLWGRSTDLCRDGIGVTVASDVAPGELAAMQVPLLWTTPIEVRASVRYRNQDHCGFEFMWLDHQQRGAIDAACETLRKASGHA